VNIDHDEAVHDTHLGYYPDGVKRTLTDDQIAMFRHSEIQTHLRQRRLKRENAADYDETTPSVQPVGDSSTSNPHDTSRDASVSTSNLQAKGKRKWQRFIELSDANPEHLTHRRIARELDEQKASSVDLAYGDEDSADSVPMKRHKSTVSTTSSQEQTVYNNKGHLAPAQPIREHRAPVFVWPTLREPNHSSV
jgi:hypothetical protein